MKHIERTLRDLLAAQAAFEAAVDDALSTKLPNPERDPLILVMRQAGWTYERIGEKVGLTRERVAQIVKRPAPLASSVALD